MKATTLLTTLLLSSLLLATSLQAATTIDPYAKLHIIPNPDGTITRPKEFFPTVPPNSSTAALSKDVPLNPDKNTWVRIYLPNGSDLPRSKKLPIILFAHGGGFVILSAATPKFDTFCSNAASELAALVVSVEYRLAPEHRLPAAYDDVLEALYWIKEEKDDWVREYGDLSRSILMGESAGGNIAYTVGLRASTLVNDLQPLVIKGLVLIQPFFGGVDRTESELRLVNDSVLPLVVTDLLWDLSLPEGVNRDHMFSNPFVPGGSSELKKIRKLGWRVMVTEGLADPLFDRQVALVNLLKKRRVHVTPVFGQDDYHGVFTNDINKARRLFEVMKIVFSDSLFYE